MRGNLAGYIPPLKFSFVKSFLSHARKKKEKKEREEHSPEAFRLMRCIITATSDVVIKSFFLSF
jgi:hypothetical protein